MTFEAPRVEIVQTDETKKGRAFSAWLLASVEADACWDSGRHEGHRPVYASFVASDAEMPAFEANLREGRACAPATSRAYGRSTPADRLDFPKSAGYVWTRQRTSEGVVLTAHLPALFAHDPGFVDPDEARLVVLPTQAWADAQREAVGEAGIARAIAHVEACGLLDRADLRGCSADARDYAMKWRAQYRHAVGRMVPTAMLFVAALDRRTRFPILADPAFGLQLFLALHTTKLREGGRPLACSSLSQRLDVTVPRGAWGERGTDDVGLAPGACLAASHEHLDTILVHEVKRYRELPLAAAAPQKAKRAARSKQRAA